MTSLIGINFHGIGAPERDLEAGEAPYWLSADQFQDIIGQIAASPDPSEFTITFDDSNLSDHDIALPVLTAHGLRARFFALTGRIGQACSLDVPHIRALSAAGMTIGSHGIDHVAWPELSDADLERELKASRERLEDICGHSVTEAGIPFGLYDARVLRALKAAGYTAAWSSDGGRFQRQAYLRPRTSLRSTMTAIEIKTVLSGKITPLRRLRRAAGMARKRWTIMGTR